MSYTKKILALLMAGALSTSLLVGCGTPAVDTPAAPDAAAAAPEATPPADSGKSYKIGVIQLVEHNALDAATKGFQDKLTELLGERVSFDYQNAQGEQTNCSTISTKFVNDGVDLIMANATLAAQSAAAATADIPIVGTSITDYEIAGLVDSSAAPGRNISGVSDLSDIAEHVALTQKLVPDAKKVGIVYCSAEDNSIVQADQAEAAYKSAGYTVTRYTASDSNDLQQVLTKATNDSDLLYIPTDNLFATNMESVKNITVPAKRPVICGEENMAKQGGLATVSADYYTIGQKAGQMAYEILENGADISTMPVQIMSGDELNTVINQEVADAIGIVVPDELKQ